MTRAGEVLAWQSAQVWFCAAVTGCAAVAPASRPARNNSAVMANGARPAKTDCLKIVFMVPKQFVVEFITGLNGTAPMWSHHRPAMALSKLWDTGNAIMKS